MDRGWRDGRNRRWVDRDVGAGARRYPGAERLRDAGQGARGRAADGARVPAGARRAGAPPGDNAALEPFLAQELEHVATLAAHLEALGAPADTAPLDVKTGDALLGKYHVPGSVTDVQTRKDSFRLLVNLESVAEGAYFTALKTLGTTELVTMSAQAMACEAQHWTVLSGLRNPGIYVKSVPWPFVTGSS